MKRFLEWIGIKEKTHNSDLLPSFEEKEIWWVYLGENVGHEEDGKGEHFLRPFVVIKKFNKELMFGVPCSSVGKKNRYYFEINLNSLNFKTHALLSQARVLSSRRLTKIVAKTGDEQFQKKNTTLIKAVFS
ncbi:MAG: type II toxin-antitoxin system PemK/MazF family toxin [Patescibacteria group bacterium]